jgi:hypothetical protein
MERNYDYTRSILKFRSNLIELILVAAFLALGIELLAGWIAGALEPHRTYTLLLALALIVGSVAYLFLRGQAGLNKKCKFEGALILTTEQHRPLPVPGYRFADRMCQYIGGLSENKALLRAWQETPLTYFREDSESELIHELSPAMRLTREALEYFVLQELSLHLSAHFDNNPEIRDSEIERIGRQDIPSILLRNRFLELFSKSMEDREAFARAPAPRSVKDLDEKRPAAPSMIQVVHLQGEISQVVYQIGSSGEIFDYFELVLPARSAVSRLDETTIAIATQRFTMYIRVVYDGFGQVLPSEFAEYYLKSKPGEVHSYKIGIDIAVEFSRLSLLTSKGWEYHQWIDSFLDKLEERFSFDRFIAEIGWKTAITTVRALKSRNKPEFRRVLPDTVAENEGAASSIVVDGVKEM